MFTGIINSIGTIRKIKKKGDKIFFIETKLKFSDLKVGSSISCSGVCLTIAQKGKKENSRWFRISASKETLSKSNIKYWKEGTMINLEKSLKIGDELSGHLVFGHVDGLSKVLSVKKVGDSLSLVCELLPFLNNYVVNKGSISLNGVSLTINKVNKEDFKVRFHKNSIAKNIIDIYNG